LPRREALGQGPAQKGADLRAQPKGQVTARDFIAAGSQARAKSVAVWCNKRRSPKGTLPHPYGKQHAPGAEQGPFSPSLCLSPSPSDVDLHDIALGI